MRERHARGVADLAAWRMTRVRMRGGAGRRLSAVRARPGAAIRAVRLRPQRRRRRARRDRGRRRRPVPRSALQREPPPLARIDADRGDAAPAHGRAGFAIRRSIADGAGRRHRPCPDAATCQACLDDLFDPASRFHRYPFVNCTHCGPRYTITRRRPTTAPNTAMARFRDVRGLRGRLRRPGQPPLPCRTHRLSGAAAPASATRSKTIAAALREGGIVALKGIGGFHLICDAPNETAVGRLRAAQSARRSRSRSWSANAASVWLFATPTRRERELLDGRRARSCCLQAGGTGRLGRAWPRRIGLMLPVCAAAPPAVPCPGLRRAATGRGARWSPPAPISPASR